MKLTPYGVLALMTKVVAGSNLQDIIKLGGFVVVSYLGLGLMFKLVHGLLVSAAGINPLRFFRKIWPVLTFAFTSRSSAATIPLSIEAQTSRLGIPRAIASFSASFGATIGQNGCAGLYPAMLAVMVSADCGHQPVGSGVDRDAGGDRDVEFGRGGRGRWRRDIRRADRAAGHGLAGLAGRLADFRRTADRHGPYGVERRRLDHRRGDYQPGDAAD